VERLHSQQPDASLTEQCTRLARETGVRVSRATMSRALRQLGLTRKKRLSGPPRRIPLRASRPAQLTRRSSKRPPPAP
jgi:transposase